MTLRQIIDAVDSGYKVHWGNTAYEVVKDKRGEYYIWCNRNDNYIGLTWADGRTLNGKEEDFFLA